MGYMVQAQFDTNGVNYIDDYDGRTLKEIKDEYHQVKGLALFDLQTRTLVYLKGNQWFVDNALDIIERYIKWLNR